MKASQGEGTVSSASWNSNVMTLKWKQVFDLSTGPGVVFDLEIGIDRRHETGTEKRTTRWRGEHERKSGVFAEAFLSGRPAGREAFFLSIRADRVADLCRPLRGRLLWKR